jgi:hypothetical protein
MYAKYGCIHVSSIIMTSSGSAMLAFPAPEPVAWCWPCSFVAEVLLLFIDLSMISSQKTPCRTGKHWDPIFARLLASSLLALLMCETSHPSNVPSRYVAPRLLLKAELLCYVPFPGSVDSTTVQNK